MHINILQGASTGGVEPRFIFLERVENESSFGNHVLEYVDTNEIHLERVVNVNDINDLVLQLVEVSFLNQAQVVNVSSFGALNLQLIPFDPENDETETLFAACDQTYPTTTKRQVDTLISEFKDAGVWLKFDWYGNAYWFTSEHDALLDWTNPARTLVKVGSAFWTQGVGLSGVTPVSNSRYKSGWNVGDGAHSGATSFAFFSKITAISAPQNGMQPMGVWRLDTGGGPATPNGSFLSLSITAGTGFAGANLMSGNGNTSFNPGDGLGVWGVSHSGSSQITVKDGVTLETDSVSGSASYTDADGMSVAGSAGTAKRSFPGTQLYWGWGGALTAAEFAAIEDAFQTAILPPQLLDGALLVDGDNYLAVDGDGNYLKAQ